MKKRYFLFMALALIFSAASAQNMRRNVFPTGRTLSLEQGQAVNALSAADFNGDGIVSMSPGPEQPPLRAPEIGSVPLSEGFEGTTGVAIPAGWIMTNSYTGTITSGSLGAWMTTGTNVHLGSRAALINLNAAPPAANWGELYSPKLTLTAGKNYQISLWMYWGTATGTTTLDDLEVYLLKGSNPATDPIIATVMDAGPFSGQTPIPQQIWTRFVINFTPDETGSDYYLLFLAGNANAFLATPGNYTGGNIRVDDVNVQELTLKQNDLAITASAYPFSQVPATQSVLPTFSANVQNLGTAAQTNVVVTVQHNGTVIGTSAPVASLDPGQTATLTVTTTTNDPVIVGNNTITYTVSQDQSDDDPSDNSFTTTFTGTPHLFATDDGNMATYSSGTANYRYGTVYTFTQQTTINQVQVYLYGTATIPHNTTANGYTLRIQALTGPNTASATNITSQTFTGVSGTTSVWTNVTLTDPLTVEAGSYFISISVNGTNNNILSDAGTQGRNKLASTNSTGTALSYGTGSAFLHLVVDLQANDIAITPTTGFPYAQIPQSIAATLPFPTTLTATATNVGTATQHNITLSATYNGADLGTSTPIATLAANAMSTAMTVTPPTSAVFPTTLGTNDVVYTVTQTETDANPGDNTVTRNFDITQNIYALDHIPSTITTTGVGYGGSTPSGLGYKVGNLFTISAPVILKQVQIGYGIGATATSHNLVLYRATYTVATGVYSVVLTNVLTPVTVARPAGGGWLTIDVPPTELEPGLYFLGVQSTANDNHAVAYDNIYGNTIYLAATGAAGASVNLSPQTGNYGAGAIRMVFANVDVFDANEIDAVGKWTLVSSELANSTKNDFTFGAASAAFKRMKKPASEGMNYTWETIPTSDLPSGQGFAYQVNPDIANSSNSYWAEHNGQKWYIDREVNTGDIQIPVESGLKYILTGNPYNKDIDLSHFGDTNLSLDGYYTTNAAGDVFPLVIEDLTIHKWQGIIISAAEGRTLGSTLTISEEPLPESVPAFTPAVSNGKMTVTAINDNGSSTAYINNKSTGTSIAGSHDMPFLNMGENQTVQVYTSKNNESGQGVKLALNTINDDVTTVPVGLFTNYEGNVSLSFSGMDTYSCDITLLDYLTGAEVNLTGLSAYQYPISVSGNTSGRFALYFGSRVPTSDNQLNNVNVQAFVRNGKINIVSNSDLQNVKICSVSGSQIANLNISGKAYIVNNVLPAGVYLVTVQTSNGILTQKVLLQ